MSKQKFQQQTIKFFTSKKGLDTAYKAMSKDQTPTKKKYYKVGNIIGYIQALEKQVTVLSTQVMSLKKEINMLNKKLSKYNLNHSPRGIDGYVFFSQEEYNGIKYMEKNLEQVIYDVKKEVLRKYFSSALAGYNKK